MPVAHYATCYKPWALAARPCSAVSPRRVDGAAANSPSLLRQRVRRSIQRSFFHHTNLKGLKGAPFSPSPTPTAKPPSAISWDTPASFIDMPPSFVAEAVVMPPAESDKYDWWRDAVVGAVQVE